MAKFEDNISPYLSFVEGAAPSSPAATNFKLYYDSSDHLLKYKNSAGTVTTLSAGFANPMTTAGDTIYGGTSGVATRLAGGTSTYVLTSNGATSAPSWQAPAGGGSGALVFLEAHTASASAQLDFTTFISSTYDDYMIEGVALQPATNSVGLYVQCGYGAGPTWDSGTNYFGSQSAGVGSSGTADSHGVAPGTGGIIAFQIANAAAYGHCSFTMRLTEPQNTSHNRNMYGNSIFHNGTQVIPSTHGNLWVNAANAMTGLRFLMSSGNIASGVIRIYGISKT